MYDNNIIFIQNNYVFTALLLIGCIATWWGFLRGTIKPWIISSVTIGTVIGTASVFLHAYCKLAGVGVETITSYDYPLITSLLVWIGIVFCVLNYLEKKQKQELEGCENE